MKKIILVLAIVCAAAVSQAASVKWTSTATSAYNGQTMYLLTSIAESYADEAALAAAAVDSAQVKKSGVKYNIAPRTASNDAITSSSNFYLAVLDGDMLHYLDVTSNFQSYVFTPPDSEPGTVSTSFATVADSATTIKVGGGGGVPEPTSGVLLIVGAAMLALRRKQK